MGFFSGKTKRIIGGQAQKLLKEEDLPRTFVQAISQYTHDVDVGNMLRINIVDYIKYFYENSLVYKLEMTYKWSKDRYKYKYLYPNVQSGDVQVINSAIKDYLISQGLDVDSIYYSSFGEMSPYYAAMQKFINQYNYDISNNVVNNLTTAHGGLITYLNDAKLKFSRHYINTVLYGSYEYARMTDYLGNPEPYFDIDVLTELPELLDTEISFRAGATFERDYDLSRGNSEYEIPSHTGGVWKTANVSGSTVTEYLPLGNIPINEALIEVVFQRKKETIKTTTITYLYVDPTDPSLGYQPPTTNSNTNTIPEVPDSVIPSDAIMYGTVDLGTTVNNSNYSDYYGYYEVTETVTGTAENYKRNVTITFEEYLYSGHYSIDPEVAWSYSFPYTVTDLTESQKQSYFQIIYLNSYGEREFYTLEGDSPEAIAIFNNVTINSEIGNFFTTIPAKQGEKDLRDLDKTQDEYKNLKKVGRKIGMDWDDLLDSLYKSFEDNLGKIRNSYITFAVPVEAEDEESQEYLYSFFNTAYNICETNNSSETYEEFYQEGVTTYTFYRYTYENGNRIQSSGLRVTVPMERTGAEPPTWIDKNIPYYKGLVWNLDDGYIGKRFALDYITKYETNETLPDDKIYDTESGDLSFSLRAKTEELERQTYVRYAKSYDRKYRIFKKQIDVNRVENILVFEPEYSFNADNGTKWFGFNEASNPENGVPKALVPIDRMVAKDLFKFNQREKLYSRNIHLVIGTVVKQKTKWYQTTLFRVVMMVIVAIIAFYFPPAGGLIGNAMAAGGAVAGTTAYAAASAMIAVASSLALQAIGAAFQGSFLGKIIQIITIAYAIYTLGSSIQTAVANGALRADWMTFMGRAGNIYKKIKAMQEGNQLQDIQDEIEKYKQDMERMDKMENTFGTGIRVDTTNTGDSIDSGFIRVGESLETMLERVLTVNQPIEAIQYISNHVDVALTLPSGEETMQRIFEQNKQRGT